MAASDDYGPYEGSTWLVDVMAGKTITWIGGAGLITILPVAEDVILYEENSLPTPTLVLMRDWDAYRARRGDLR